MTRLTRYLREEPVRLYLYTVSVALVALLAFMGVMSATAAPLVLALITAVLAVPGTESLRSRVSPARPEQE